VSLKISIITPSFNQGKYLEETIQSILNQGYPDLEYIIIDGGSSDQSVEIIKKYSSSLAYWISEQDNGQSDAINKGILKATGEIITWIGSDDLLAEGALKTVASLFESLPALVGVIHGNTQLFTDNKILRTDKGYAVQNPERRLSGMTFPQPSSFIRKNYLVKKGPLDIRYHYGMDYDLFSRLSVLCDFHYTDTLLSGYRLHSQSKSSTSLKGFSNDWMIIFNKIAEGMKLDFVLNELDATGLRRPSGDAVNFFASLQYAPVVDQSLLMYYFLTNILKYDYESGSFTEAKNISVHLRQHYMKYLLNDPDVKRITNRLNYPVIFISALRRMKRNLSRSG